MVDDEMVYLDANATTRPLPEVAAAMAEAMDQWWANPSSVHRGGAAVRQRIELVRESVADWLEVRPRQVVFTSGGTESTNLAIHGLLGAAARGRLVTSKVEHSAVREVAEWLEARGGSEGGRATEVLWLDVDGEGRVDPGSLEATLDAIASESAPGGSGGAGGGESLDDVVTLVSVQAANNETGVLQPIDALLAVIDRWRGRGEGAEAGRRLPGRLLFHVDATQAVGKIPVSMRRLPVDLLTFSGHKFHGPKGVGGLVLGRGVRMSGVIQGGPQERGVRPGTENTAALLGLGPAVEAGRSLVADDVELARLAGLRDHFERLLLADLPEAVIHGRNVDRLWNTSHVAFPRLESEAILVALSERGVYASAGAACSSGSLEPSPVLRAMGLPDAEAHGSVRFSFDRFMDSAALVRAAGVITEVVRKLSSSMASLS